MREKALSFSGDVTTRVLDHAGPRPLRIGLTPFIESKIVNVLIKLKANGFSEISLKSSNDKLIHLAKYSDLDNPEAIKLFIANKKSKASFKRTSVKDYHTYIKFNGLGWNKPIYHEKRGLPRPPNKEQV